MDVRAQQHGKKLTLAGLLVVFLFVGAAAQAQVDPITSVNTGISAGSNVVSTGKIVQTTVWDTVKIALANTAALALLNASNYFLQRLAYDTANYIASGGKGQAPLFTTKGIGDELKTVGLDAAGEALGTITDVSGLGALGVNLCAPTNPRIVLNIKLGYAGAVAPPIPKCSWSQLSSNWDQFTSQSSAQVLDQVGVQFSPDNQTSLGAALQFNRTALELVSSKQSAAALDYLTAGGFKSVTGAISGQVKTPAVIVQEELKQTNALTKEQQSKDVAVADAAFSAGAYQGVLGAALKTFTNTLAEKLMKRLFEKGIISVGSLISSNSDALTNANAVVTGGQAAAELANASLLTPKIYSGTNYDALLDFASCPTGAAKGPNNCVMEGRFSSAVSRASEGSPLTVQQAVDQGFINGGWRLLPLSHTKNTDPTCYLDAFCYSNLVKMRAARIIPVGWELAANSPFNDLNNPVTLREAMDRFNDCPFKTDANGNQVVDATKLPDAAHPWCRMIDPNWVLKYPKSICRLQGPGPELQDPGSSVRAQTCVDAPSCINEDANGNCTAGYGYCVRERSAWKIDADSCQPQNASCQALTRADGQSFAFLLNTVKAGICNADNAGCTGRSVSQNAVPNGGFEDVVGGIARDWSAFRGTGLEQSSDAMRGGNAGWLTTGTLETVGNVLGGKTYQLSFSAKSSTDVSAAADAAATITFSDINGKAIDAAIVSNCSADSTRGFVTSRVSLSRLGYQTATCNVTAPATAAKFALDIRLEHTITQSFVDEVGLFGESYSSAPLDNMFLNAKADACPQGSVGCRALVTASSAALNLIRNPGFEDRTEDGKRPTGWTGVSESDYSNDGQHSSEGTGAVSIPASGSVTQTVHGILPNAAYTFSAYAQGSAAAPVVYIRPYNAAGTEIPSGNLCSGTTASKALAAGTNFVRTTCTFTAPDGAVAFGISFGKSSSAAAYIDAVQLELGIAATDFHAGYASNAQEIHLKVAPEGLSCTGASTDPAACAGFAKSCRREDVGCSLYAPVGGGTSIPAVTTAGDACPVACVGYDAYREEPTNFSDETFPVPFIPSTAASCTAKEAGCQEFTNIEKLAKGGEAREYFTGIRLCQKPDDQTATYYTWEGNDLKGFQLRTWTLRRSQSASAAGTADPTAGTAPCTNLGYDSSGQPVCKDTAATVASCSKDAMRFNPDCREFYDIDGNIHYRLYSRTVLSSDQCTEYRMTNATETSCTNHGGLWIRNECHYFGYAPENVSCQASANNCRAYTGNAARNIRIAVNDSFEDGTRDLWTPVAASQTQPSNEAVTVGGKSLKVTTAAIAKPLVQNGLPMVTKGKSYLVAFWAKGTGDVTPGIDLGAGSVRTATPASVSLATDWHQYLVGPIVLDAAPTAATMFSMSFSAATADRPVYIDNIELREITDSIYVIKGSWKTPAACDQDANGNAAPQYMLGCKAYKDQANKESSFKSFSRLCKQEAVGCGAFYDTQNTASPFAETWNAVCSLDATCTPAANGAKSTCTCTATGGSTCEVRPGEKSCRFNVSDSVPDSELSEKGTSPLGDVVRVKPDAITYLIDDAQYRCDASELGCSAMAKPTLDPDQKAPVSWTTVFVKNDPSKYGQTLCTQPENSCQAWTRAEDGSPTYFKDPENRTCDFRSDITLNGNRTSGWFKKGTNDPCYPDYLTSGSSYGIWKNSDAKYANWVGTCDASQSMCKEFLDPTDKAADFPDGRPYYFIKNSRLDVKSCAGQVSRTTSPSGSTIASACALFKQSDDPTLTFDATRSYDLSEKQFGALVNPIDDRASALAGAANDSNIILRATRDRQCSQWLDCRSSESVFNPSTGAFQDVCTSFALCAEYQKVGDTTRCVKYVDSTYKDPTNPAATNNVLDAKIYASRDIGWGSKEYSGDAVPYRYPIDQLQTVGIPDPTNALSTAPAAPAAPGVIVLPGSSGTAKSNLAKKDPRLVYTNGASCGNDFTACGPKNNRGNLGTCINNQCVWPIDGGPPVSAFADLQQASAKITYPNASCRVYPKEDAPFPGSVADPAGWDYSVSDINGGNPRLNGAKPAFDGANVCQRRNVKVGNDFVTFDSCECGYIRASYGGTVSKYFPLGGPDIPNGYCEEGVYKDLECDPTATGLRAGSNLSCCSKLSEPDPVTGQRDCEVDSGCRALSKTDYLVGYQGQCIERDLSTPINGRSDEFACANWRPTGLVGGTLDIYNLNRSAGYFAPIDRRFYCADHTPITSMNIGNVATPVGPTIDIGVENTEAAHGDQGPMFQPANRFFAPGAVTHAWPNTNSQNTDCTSVSNDHGGYLCDFPGIATTCAPATPATPHNGVCEFGETAAANPDDCKNQNPPSAPVCANPNSANTFLLRSPISYGIVGCYEVASSNDKQPEDPTVEWPYVGPAMYKDQLAGVRFNFGRNMNDSFPGSTNPHQAIAHDCDDESSENSDITPGGLTCDLFDGNSWKNDGCASFGGKITLQANFDKSGQLHSIKMTAHDDDDTGTFAIKSLSFLYKPTCQTVARVDEVGQLGLTKANTELVNANRKFGTDPGVVSSAYEQACRPWGAIGSQTQDPLSDPNDITTATRWTSVALTAVDPKNPGHEIAQNQCTESSFRKASSYILSPQTPHASDDVGQFLSTLFHKISVAWTFTPWSTSNVDFGGKPLIQQYTKAGAALKRCVSAPSIVCTQDTDCPGFTKCQIPAATSADAFYSSDATPPHGPRVASVDTGNCANGVCPVRKMYTVTLNGTDSGVLNGQNGILPVNMQFYAWASNSSMPIRSRTVRWGDNLPSEPPASGWYKNHKPYCSPDESDANAAHECVDIPGLTCRTDADCPNSTCGTAPAIAHFGSTPGACDTKPYAFEHTYTCSFTDLRTLGAKACNIDKTTDRATNAPCVRNDATTGNAPACVYKPRVQVMDNWGFCNCAGTGCPIGGLSDAKNQCDIDVAAPANAAPWTNFNGEIRIQPSQGSLDDYAAFLKSGALPSDTPPITQRID